MKIKANKLIAVLCAVVMLVTTMVPALTLTAFAEDTVITFNLGANGSATHTDNNTAKSTYSETVDGYTLNITGGSKMYPDSRDAKGNSAIKLGTSSAAGSFSLTVPDDVTSVIIYAAKYKTNASALVINSKTYTLTKASNNGQYDEIIIDTSTTKTISVKTSGTSKNQRAMIDKIVFVVPSSDAPVCEHANTTVETVDATCRIPGTSTETCVDCGVKLSTETIPAAHSFVDGTCKCGVIETPVANTPYVFGMAQGNKNYTVYYITGVMSGYYMATTTDANKALVVYLEETDGGYYMYGFVNGVKTYINMVVSGTYVNGAYQTTASTVYTVDAEHNTVIANVNSEDYWFGTRNDNTYTTAGPCLVSFNGFYCEFYAHAHNFVADETIDPTCTEDGYTTYVCDCGATENRDFVDALSHDFADATCTAPKTCSVCGATEGEALGHTFVNSICACGAGSIEASFLQVQVREDGMADVRLVLTLTADELATLNEVGVYASLDKDNKGVGYATTTVYETVNAGGKVVDAKEGTYFVLVEIINISDFDAKIYVTPFVATETTEALGAMVAFSVNQYID